MTQTPDLKAQWDQHHKQLMDSKDTKDKNTKDKVQKQSNTKDTDLDPETQLRTSFLDWIQDAVTQSLENANSLVQAERTKRKDMEDECEKYKVMYFKLVTSKEKEQEMIVQQRANATALNTIQAEYQKCRVDYSNLVVDHQATRERLDDAEKTLLETRTAYEQSLLMNEKLQVMQKVAEKAAMDAESRAQQLEADMHQLKALHADLKASLIQCTESSSGLTSQVLELQANRKDLLARLEVNDKLVVELRSQLEIKTSLGDELVTKNAELSQALQIAEQLAVDLSEQLSTSVLREKALQTRETQIRDELSKVALKLSQAEADLLQQSALVSSRKEKDKQTEEKMVTYRTETEQMKIRLEDSLQREKLSKLDLVNVRKENVDLSTELFNARRENADARTRAALKAKSLEAEAASKMAEALASKVYLYESAISAMYQASPARTSSSSTDLNEQIDSASQVVAGIRDARKNLWYDAERKHSQMKERDKSKVGILSTTPPSLSLSSLTAAAANSGIPIVLENFTASELARQFNRADRLYSHSRATYCKISSSSLSQYATNSTQYGLSVLDEQQQDLSFDESKNATTLDMISAEIDNQARLRSELEEAQRTLVTSKKLVEAKEEELASLKLRLMDEVNKRCQVESELDKNDLRLTGCTLVLETLRDRPALQAAEDHERITQDVLKKIRDIEVKNVATEVRKMFVDKISTTAVVPMEEAQVPATTPAKSSAASTSVSKKKPFTFTNSSNTTTAIFAAAATPVSEASSAGTMVGTTNSSLIRRLEVQIIGLEEELRSALELVEQRGQKLQVLQDTLEDRERDVYTQREALGEGKIRYDQKVRQLEHTQSALEKEERKCLQLTKDLNNASAEIQSLRDTLDSKVAELDKTRSDLQGTRQLLRQSNEKNLSLEQEISKLESEVRSCESTIQRMTMEISRTRQDLEQKSRDHIESEQRCAEAGREIDRLEKALSDAHSSIEAHEKKEDELRDSISRQQTALFELHERLKDIEYARGTHVTKIESLQKQRDSITKEREALSTQFDALTQKERSAKEQVEKLREEISAKNDRVSALESQYTSEASKNKSLESKLNSALQAVNLKERIIIEHTASARTLSLKQTERIESLVKQLKEASEDMARLSRQLEAVNHKADIQSEDIRILREEIETLETTLSETETELQSEKDAHNKTKAERDTLVNELNETRTELRKTELRLQDTQHSLDETRDSYSSLMGDMQELNSHAKEWHLELTNTKETLRDTIKQVHAKEEQIRVLRQQIADLNKQMTLSEAKIQKQEDEKTQLTNQLNTAKEDIENLKGQLGIQASNIAKLEDQLVEVHRRHNETIYELKTVEAQRHAQEEYNQRLESSYACAVEERATHRRRHLECETRVIELETELAFASKKHGVAGASVSPPALGGKSAAQSAASSAAAKKGVDDEKRLRSEWEKKISMVESLEKALSSAEVQIARLQSEKNEMQTNLKFSKEELKRATQRLNELENEIKQMERKLRPPLQSPSELKQTDGSNKEGKGDLASWAVRMDLKLKQAEEQLTEKENMLQAQESQIRELQRNIETLKQEMLITEGAHQKHDQSLREEISHLEDRIEQTRKELDSDKSHFEAQMLGLNTEREQLFVLNEKLRAELDKTRETLTETEQSLHRMTDEKNEASTRRRELEGELANLKDQLAKAKNAEKKTTRTASVERSAAANEKIAADMIVLEERVKALEAELKEAQSQVNTLKPLAQRTQMATRAMEEMNAKMKEVEKDALQRLTRNEAELRIRAQQIQLLEEECARARSNYIAVRDRLLTNISQPGSQPGVMFAASTVAGGKPVGQSQLALVESELLNASGNASEMAKRAFVSVQFKVSNVRQFIETHQNIHVVGSDIALGQWNPIASPSLKAVKSLPDGTFVLCGEFSLPRSLGQVEYKYCVEKSDGSFVWEGGVNRQIKLQDAPPSMELRDVWHT